MGESLPSGCVAVSARFLKNLGINSTLLAKSSFDSHLRVLGTARWQRRRKRLPWAVLRCTAHSAARRVLFSLPSHE